PRPRHVRRAHRGDGSRRGAVRRAAPPLHLAPPAEPAPPRRRPQDPAARDRGYRPRRRRPACRLSLRPALPARHRALSRGRARADPDRGPPGGRVLAQRPGGDRMTALLAIRGLRVEYPVRAGWLARGRLTIKAVDGVDLELEPGETLGLVGE